MGNAIDLVLTDMIMPEMGGRRPPPTSRRFYRTPGSCTCRAIRKPTSFSVASASADHPFLQKPFSSESLAASVRRHAIDRANCLQLDPRHSPHRRHSPILRLTERRRPRRSEFFPGWHACLTKARRKEDRGAVRADRGHRDRHVHDPPAGWPPGVAAHGHPDPGRRHRSLVRDRRRVAQAGRARERPPREPGLLPGPDPGVGLGERHRARSPGPAGDPRAVSARLEDVVRRTRAASATAAPTIPGSP